MYAQSLQKRDNTGALLHKVLCGESSEKNASLLLEQ
jgi:hypothetical protein